MIKLFRMNTGSCGGCDIEIITVVARNADMGWADEPRDANALLLTGPLTPTSRLAFLAIWHELAGRIPLIAIGRCAIDGYPFGRGGLAEMPEIATTLKLDGCPPDPEAIADAIRAVVRAT